MTQTEKAEKYELLTKQGDAVQRKLSKLQSQNAGINTVTEAYDTELKYLRGRMSFLEQEMRELFN